MQREKSAKIDIFDNECKDCVWFYPATEELGESHCRRWPMEVQAIPMRVSQVETIGGGGGGIAPIPMPIPRPHYPKGCCGEFVQFPGVRVLK